MEIDVRVDSEAVERALARLSAAAADLTPAMLAISGILADEAERSFEAEAGPDGRAWPDLADSTKRARGRRGHWPGPMLQVSGRLAGSITGAHGPDFAAAGTNVVYAAVQQFGGRAGRGGAAEIPPRPFLGLSARGEEEALDVLADHLERALRA